MDLETGSRSLSPHEAEVLLHLSENPQHISQREIAQRTGFSLGLVNAILKKLVRTGYVKASNLNKKQLQYLLTPKGFAEKTFKSYRYIVRTIQEYRVIESQIIDLIKRLNGQGYQKFSIDGNGAIRELIEIAFREKLRDLPVELNRTHGDCEKSAILALHHRKMESGKAFCVNVLMELEKL